MHLPRKCWFTLGCPFQFFAVFDTTFTFTELCSVPSAPMPSCQPSSIGLLGRKRPKSRAMIYTCDRAALSRSGPSAHQQPGRDATCNFALTFAAWPILALFQKSVMISPLKTRTLHDMRVAALERGRDQPIDATNGAVGN